MTTASPTTSPAHTRTQRPRLWALSGILAGVGSIASVYLSMTLSPEYVPGSVITPDVINDGLMAERHVMIAFHVVTVATAVLVLLFGAGLQRRLREALPAASLVPTVAFAGMLLVTVAQMLGTGLDTEFLFGTADTAINLPSDIGFYSHWIATIPWLWLGGGIAALAVGAAGRGRAVPRWISVTGLLLGGLTLFVALSPLQYIAAAPGALWLLVTAIGFAVGDRAHRAG
ncbi:hypothetical protein [Microbacterium sp. GXF7504]